MDPLQIAITEAGGAAGRRYLVDLGFRDRELRAAVTAGRVLRARRGWYTVWSAEDPRFAALRLGGRLTGLAAIRALGGWVLHPPRDEVAVARNAARLRDPHRARRALRARRDRGIVVHWSAARHDRDVSSGVVPVFDALVVVLRTEPEETAIAALDWALRAGAIDADERDELARSIPSRVRQRVHLADPSCDSLPESLARTRLRTAGLVVRSQVALGGTSPIDLLVGGVVALEVDGDAHHRDRFEHDRQKDLVITIAGMHAVRPSARHVFHDWGAVIGAVRRALRERGALHDAVAEQQPRRRNTRRPGALSSA